MVSRWLLRLTLATSSFAVARPSAFSTVRRCPRIWWTRRWLPAMKPWPLLIWAGSIVRHGFSRPRARPGCAPLWGRRSLYLQVRRAPPPPVLLLVEDRRGYRNLCRLITRMKQGRRKGEGAATMEMLAEHAAGLIALLGPAPRADAADLAALFGRAAPFLRCSDTSTPRRSGKTAPCSPRPLPALSRWSPATTCATPPRIEGPTHDVLTCIRAGVTVDEIGRRLPRNAERFLKRPEEMAARFRDLPAALACSHEIAERCRFTLSDLGYSFPSYPVPDGETQQSFLEAMTWQGAAATLSAHDRQSAGPACARAAHHRQARSGRLFLGGLGHRRVRPQPRHHGARARLSRQQRHLLRAGHHRGRSGGHGAAVRAFPIRRAGEERLQHRGPHARHRSRFAVG